MTRERYSRGSEFERLLNYSRVVVVGDQVFVSGCSGFDYDTMEISDNVTDQAEQTFENIRWSLEQAGVSFEDVVRIRILAILPIVEVISAQSKHKAIVQGYGAIFQIVFTDQAEIRDYRQYCQYVEESKFKRFANLLRDEGVYINPVNSLKNSCSIAHDEDDEDLTALAIGRALARLA